jgi:hypothetical protein
MKFFTFISNFYYKNSKSIDIIIIIITFISLTLNTTIYFYQYIDFIPYLKLSTIQIISLILINFKKISLLFKYIIKNLNLNSNNIINRNDLNIKPYLNNFALIKYHKSPIFLTQTFYITFYFLTINNFSNINKVNLIYNIMEKKIYFTNTLKIFIVILCKNNDRIENNIAIKIYNIKNKFYLK